MNMHVIPVTSEQADEVAWEYGSAGHPTSIVKKNTRPPAILRGGGDSDNIPGLEVELFVDRSTVVVQSANWIEFNSVRREYREACSVP
jgi:hypothetical protein